MNRILKVVKLDFYSSKSVFATFTLLFVLNTATNFITRSPLSAISMGMLFAVTVSGAIFVTHNSSHNGRLYGVLPLKKSDVVLGRYLYGTIIGIISIIFAYMLSFVISIIFNLYSSFEVMNTCLPPMAALMFIYYCLSMSVSYPLFLSAGYKTVMLIPLVLINLLLSTYGIPFLYTQSPDSPGWIERNEKLFIGINLWLTVAVGFAIGFILIIISAFIANIIYKKKEI